MTLLKGIHRTEGQPTPLAELMDDADRARFWSKVDRACDGCHEWTGALGQNGYGEFRVHEDNCRYRYRSHRVAYELAYGVALTEDHVVRHKCDNRSCCNPAHLEVGTHSDNVRDRVERGRSAAGSQNGRAKLTEEGVKIARYCMDTLGVKPTELAKVTGMDAKTFRNIRAGLKWA